MPIFAIRNFLRLEASGGILLIGAALLAILVDNSPASGLYSSLLGLPFTIGLGDAVLSKPLLLWINDGLMAVFFLLIGLEVKRELFEGQLAGLDRVLLPAAAAVGGMAVPAAIFLAVTANEPGAREGWAIPAATDIAFALGIMALLGKRVPLSLKIFLSTVAVIDDLGAIVIIAIFFSGSLSPVALMLAGLCLAALIALNRMRVHSLAPYILIGIAMWLCVLQSGVHATLAGVALAFAIPLRGRLGARPLETLEEALHPSVIYLILPLFAFANAGLPLLDLELASLAAPLPLGVALGLFLGKQIGVAGGAMLMIGSGFARMPHGTNRLGLYGTACLTGIGFTMSLFIGGLAFDDPNRLTEVRLGVLLGSLASGLLGATLLYRATRRPRDTASGTQALQ